MKVYTAPLIEPGRIMVLENDVVVIDGRLSDLISDDGEDGANFGVYLNPPTSRDSGNGGAGAKRSGGRIESNDCTRHPDGVAAGCVCDQQIDRT